MENGIQVSLPVFTVECNPQYRKPLGRTFSRVQGHEVGIFFEKFNPDPFLFEKDGHRVALLGSPVYGERIEKLRLCEDFVEKHFSDEWLRTINGEFLFLYGDPDQAKLIVVNSRFTSPPFYYFARESIFLGSFSYYDLWIRLHQLGLLEIQEQGFYELLQFKRVFGDKTHDRGSLFLGPASVLSWDGTAVQTRRYWQPEFRNKMHISLQQSAELMAKGTLKSIERKTSDQKRYGLFLSGGMDTRTILAGFGRLGVLPVCFTVNQFENREVQIAREVARVVGARHVFLPFRNQHYGQAFPYALNVVGAMQLPMCMFIGFEDSVRSAVDVAFHGHGFDYLFQGMYIPAKHLELLGHRLEYRWIRPVPEDLVGFFAANISYRTKGGDAVELVESRHRKRLHEGVINELECIRRRAEGFCDSAYDVLEYLTFHNLSRHYTYGDHWGINTNVEQRTISFDNDLYELYQCFSARDRFDGKIERLCLRILNQRLGDLLSANNAYPMKASSMSRTYYQVRNYGLIKLGVLDRDFYRDDGFQRMGLPLDYVLRRDLRPLVEELLCSDRLAVLGFMDMDKMRARVGEWLGREKGGDQVLYSLVTMDQFLKRLAE